MSLLSLLGDKLRKPDGSTVAISEALGNKSVIALYFSAHWCPPCKGFTPIVSKKYLALKEANEDFEMLFVSSDKDVDAFNGYHKEMTFLALPFEERAAKAKLSKKFKVQGIPTLVFYDLKEDKVITTDGREVISEETFLEDFPYRPVPVDVLATLGAELRKPDGSMVATSDAVGNKSVLGIYFSAHWCPPCRAFTPTLSSKYTALKEAGKDFELIFASGDKDAAAFEEYHKEMSFLALPFDKRDEKETLSKYFKVNGIPALIFFDLKTGKLVTDEGRGGISSDTFVEDFPYYPKPVNDLSGSTDGINDSVALVVLMEDAPQEMKDEITKALTEFATAELAKPEDQLVFEKFFTGKGGGPVDKVRSGCGYKDAAKTEAVMLVLDLDDEGAYYHPNDDFKTVTVENIKAFMAAFTENKLTKKQFGK